MVCRYGWLVCLFSSSLLLLFHLLRLLLSLSVHKLEFSKGRNTWILYPMMWQWLGFPGGSAGKLATWNAGDLGLIPGLVKFSMLLSESLWFCCIFTNMVKPESSEWRFYFWKHKSYLDLCTCSISVWNKCVVGQGIFWNITHLYKYPLIMTSNVLEIYNLDYKQFNYR